MESKKRHFMTFQGKGLYFYSLYTHVYRHQVGAILGKHMHGEDALKRRKKIHAVLSILEDYPNIGRTLLLKFIFFMDLFHYHHRKEFLFDSEYVRMPHGPGDTVTNMITSDSNEYIRVTRIRKNYRPRSTVTYPSYQFRPLMPADKTIFSSYEKALFKMILQVLQRSRATDISDLTHELRLWKEFRDGDTIPPQYFELNDHEIKLLEDYGFCIDGFQRLFCSKILDESRGIVESISPLSEDRITSVDEVLDDFIRQYPIPDLDVFYDAYLAWDDTFRTAVRKKPEVSLRLADRCCDDLCFIVLSKFLRTKQDELEQICQGIATEYDNMKKTISSEAGPHRTLPPDINNIVNATMELSRNLARNS